MGGPRVMNYDYPPSWKAYWKENGYDESGRKRDADADAQHSAKRGKRGAPRTHARGVELFTQTILKWPVCALEVDQLNSRKALHLPPLQEMPSQVANEVHYYGLLEELAVEEARASISEGLTSIRRSGGETAQLMLRTIKAGAGKGGMAVLEFEAKGVPSPSMRQAFRPGGIFRAAPPGVRGGEGQWDSRGGRQRGCGGLAAAERKGKRLRGRETEADEEHSTACIAAVAFAGMASSASREAEVTLWMVLPGEWEASGALREGGVWALQPLAAVISQQRMAAACFMRPKLPFMNKLLGMPPAKHTKFALSDDEDDEDDEEVSDEGGEKGEEEEGGRGGEAEETMSEEGEGPGAVEDRTQPAEATSDAAVEAVARAAEEAERGLNQSQQKALRMFLESSSGHLQLVQGPPGCGKTHFLAALLQGLRLKGVRTLVCAPSNKAVCVALDKVRSPHQRALDDVLSMCERRPPVLNAPRPIRHNRHEKLPAALGW
ncbi:hypothetical protein CYMTET_23809 [Cymbomonas tetramitiformis]|uniref:DNA2/NAM7 helicase helicase domain-containing protein n=1 Tax=Cymbomonas tetramitiformis TaxID=36881 RepID=A0AAE0FYK0_9CHLO|nr:hypothetical protein CYMTET_23809 [Cymbomonas tetramitiformis]